jgi:hypothetical protein
MTKSGETEENVRIDEASNTLEESEGTENVVNAHDKGTQNNMIADQDLQGKHGSLKEATNMDVQEIGNVSNADQDGSKEDEMNVDSKDKEPSASEIPDKVIENDLEENLNQDDEASIHPNEGIVNSVAKEKMSMNESEADGGHSGDEEDMQVENSEKNGEKTIDVTKTN